MNKEQAIQILAQIAQDFINTLPVSARAPLSQSANAALAALDPKKETAPEKKEERP